MPPKSCLRRQRHRSRRRHHARSEGFAPCSFGRRRVRCPLIRPYENMRFHLGASEGHDLPSRCCSAAGSPGVWHAVDYSACPARWWHPHSFTDRRPGGADDIGIADAGTAQRLQRAAGPRSAGWLEALLGDICKASPGPQRCCYMPGPTDRGAPPAGEWTMRAQLPTAEIERQIGRAGATPSPLRVTKRPGFGTPADSMPGYPAYPANCRVDASLRPARSSHLSNSRPTWSARPGFMARSL